MAGTIPLSLTQQFDIYGQPLAGGQLYLIQAGTVSTPQDGFQDTNLTIKMPYPITLDAAGRIPQFFLADGTIKVRLQDKNGVVQLAADSILVIGPSAGGGGGSTVDPTQLIQTGSMILRYGVGVIAGYVRLNGLTIGPSTSNALERANADCQNLFLYLWGADPNLIVKDNSGTVGRGATAALDWQNSKQIATPDWRGYAFGCLDDMGNSPAGRLSATYWGGNPILLGSAGGGESLALVAGQIPPISYSVNNVAISVTGPNGHSMVIDQSGDSMVPNAGGSKGWFSGGVLANANTVGFSGNIPSIIVTSALTLGQAHRTVGPRKLCTGYIKL